MTKDRRLAICLWVSLGFNAACAGDPDTVTAPEGRGNTASHGDSDAIIPSKKYVALGSSFAAGPGIPEAVPGQSCGRSTANYAHLVTAQLGLDLIEASCIGATIDNVTTTAQAMNPPQIEAVTSDTSVITITIGGNDVFYSASLTTCGRDGMNGTSCLEARGGAAAPDIDSFAIDSRLEQEASKLVAMLGQLKQAAPAARIYLVAYPLILPEPAMACPPDVPLLAADADFLGNVGMKLQAAFSAAAAMAGVTFVDLYSASRGHDACAPADQRWVEGQANPSLVPYHPNLVGMRAAAELIVSAIQKGSR